MFVMFENHGFDNFISLKHDRNEIFWYFTSVKPNTQLLRISKILFTYLSIIIIIFICIIDKRNYIFSILSKQPKIIRFVCTSQVQHNRISIFDNIHNILLKSIFYGPSQLSMATNIQLTNALLVTCKLVIAQHCIYVYISQGET